MRRHFACIAAGLLLPGVFVDAAEVYVRYDQLEWEEENDAGRRVLKEEGPLLGIGITAERPLGATWTAAGRLEGFLGEVDYDGSTQLGAPVRTTTEYYGLRGEADARRPFDAAGSLHLSPFAGLGVRTWLRRLDNAGLDTGGYDEWWLAAYGRGGLRAEGEVRGAALFAEAALRVPLYNGVRYDLTLDGREVDATLEPGRELTLSAELGVRIRDAVLALFFEQLSFGRSDVEQVPPYDIVQHEADGYLVGLRIGLAL